MSLRKYNKFLNDILGGSCLYNVKDKEACTRQQIVYMLNRTMSMFEYDGLPDSIPHRILELYLQMNGNVCWYEYQGELYVFTGGLGGEPDVYYMPTIYTVANPALKISKSLKIGEECVVMPNDSLYIGLLPMFRKYASMLSENELSMNVALINSRIVSLISAPDSRTEASARQYLKDIVDGELGVISENAFLDGIQTNAYKVGGSGQIGELIEHEQYLKASWFNEIGLNANYNMKREALNTTESQLNNDALLPLVDDMLRCREQGLEKVNAMFGTSISVKLSSSWEDNQQEIEMALEGKEDEGKEGGDSSGVGEVKSDDTGSDGDDKDGNGDDKS